MYFFALFAILAARVFSPFIYGRHNKKPCTVFSTAHGSRIEFMIVFLIGARILQLFGTEEKHVFDVRVAEFLSNVLKP